MTSIKPRIKVLIEPEWMPTIWRDFEGDNLSEKIHKLVKREVERLEYQSKLRAMQEARKELSALDSLDSLFAE